MVGLLATPLTCTAFQPLTQAVEYAIRLCNGFDQELCNVRQRYLLWVCCRMLVLLAPQKHGVCCRPCQRAHTV